MDYEVRQLSSRVGSALVVVVCDMELNAVKVPEWSGTKRSSTAKGSLYNMGSHLLARCPPLGGAGLRCRAGPLHDERPSPLHSFVK